MFQKTLTGGRYNESNYPVQELWRKRGGGRIFEGGVLAGQYGMVICRIAEQGDRVRLMPSGFWRPQLEWVEESYV